MCSSWSLRHSLRGWDSLMQEATSSMANPFVRMVVNFVVMGAGVFSRAFVAAYHQAIQNAKSGSTQAAKAATTRGGMATDEALKVLNLTKAELQDTVKIQQQYDKYFGQNDPSKGGSFYLQSKIFRAKESLDREIAEAKARADAAKERARSTKPGDGEGGSQ